MTKHKFILYNSNILKVFGRGLKINMKKINEIFSDYEAEGNINAAIVESAVLNKKTKTLDLQISSDKYIKIREFECLDKFMKERFALEDSIITVKYASGTDKKPIEEEMHDIVVSLANKFPALKAMLNNSEYEVADNTINFNFKMAVSGFLKAMDYDKKVHETIKNLYGTAYKINFVDKLSSEELKRQQEEMRAGEMLPVQKEVKSPPSSYEPKLPRAAAVQKQEVKAETDGKKGDSSLILGRNAKIKEPIIKITDITPDEGRIAIEGEISNIEARELKSGKILVSFDLYDGSSSMTCKAFLKPEEGGEIVPRLEKAKGVMYITNNLPVRYLIHVLPPPFLPLNQL
jgi:DNA polymerase-3 subunit alpha (Gram-positive type)